MLIVGGGGPLQKSYVEKILAQNEVAVICDQPFLFKKRLTVVLSLREKILRRRTWDRLGKYKNKNSRQISVAKKTKERKLWRTL